MPFPNFATLGANTPVYFLAYGSQDIRIDSCRRAYSPRAMWSNLHGSPADAVRMFKDVRAKKALAMHWG